MADGVGIYLIFYLIKGVAFGNTLHFNVTASMSGNQHSRSEGLIGAMPQAGLSVLARNVSQLRTEPFLSRLFLVFAVSLFQVESARGVKSSGDTAPLQYHVEGRISYLLGDSTAPYFERPFTLMVSNADWSIEIIPNDVENVAYYQVARFGGDIYYYTAFQKSSSRAGLNDGTAEIAKQEQPVEKGMFASYVWLGLASSYYFKSRSGNAVQPIWAKSSEAEAVKAKWETFDGNPFLPAYAAYYHNGRNYSAPFDNGWLAGEFNVSSHSNVAGLTFPTEFTFEYHQPKKDAISLEDLELAYRVKVTVQSVHAPVLTDIWPPIMQGPTLIEEQRLPGPLSPDLSVQYLSTNRASLPSAREEIATRKYYSVKKLDVAAPEDSWSRFRALFLAFLIISSGIAIFIAVRKTKTEYQTKT